SGSTTLQNGSLTGTSYSVSNASGTATISASLLASGTTGLAKSLAGWLVLSNSNAYTGTTTVTGGALNIQNALALGGTAAGTVVNGGSLELQGGITVAGEALSLGTSTTAGLRNISGNNTWDGLVTLIATSRINSDSGTLTLSNLGTITGTTFALWVGGSANTVLNSILGTTTGGLVKDGTGTLTLTAANTYTGVTTINAGVLDLQNALALGGTAGGTTVAAGAALQLRGGITIGNETLSLSGSGIGNTGALRNISGNNTYGGVLTLTPVTRIQSDAGILTLSNTGAIGWAATGRLFVGGDGDTIMNSTFSTNAYFITKEGAGRLTLTGSNSFSGTVSVTTLSSGTLLLSNAFALQACALTADAGSAVFDSSVVGNAFTIGGLSGSLSIPLVNNASTPAPVALTVSTVITNTYSGSLSGGGSLIKSLAGTLVLSGSNSYSGTTLISGGMLQFAKASSLYGGDSASSWTKANITVTTGGTLGMNVGGSGEFTTGNVTTLLTNLGGAVTTAGLRAGSAIGFDTSNASGGTFTVADTIANTTGTGGGSVGLVKYGTGSLVLAGSNSY
ncbi:MAG: autotransporter-associated beta strand repeat-containing protein, partial [Planctomycetia bacterium]|nr:autotransporter-associated beta strand repeat-containing protein [Planctomycetia bacterium]